MSRISISRIIFSLCVILLRFLPICLLSQRRCCKEPRTRAETAFLLPSFLSNFPYFILPQQAHLSTLISSNVARRKCVGSRPPHVYIRIIRHCVDTNYFSRDIRENVFYFGSQPETRRLCLVISHERRIEGLIKLKDFPNRNLDYSWATAEVGTNNTCNSTRRSK